MVETHSSDEEGCSLDEKKDLISDDLGLNASLGIKDKRRLGMSLALLKNVKVGEKKRRGARIARELLEMASCVAGQRKLRLRKRYSFFP